MIGIINYGMGNLRSVQKAFERIGSSAFIISEPSDLKHASKIILPGVGHFAKGMQNLNALGFSDVIKEEVLVNKKQILGICLGMQLLTKWSDEGNCEGLNIIDASTRRFNPEDKELKIPHMGWNEIVPVKESFLLKGLEFKALMYFVHSYYVSCTSENDRLFSTEYGITFDSGFEKENIVGFQFHPEKSHKAGLLLLKNFLST